MGERRTAGRRSACAAPRPEWRSPAAARPGARTFRWSPVTKSAARHARARAVPRPERDDASSATVSEISAPAGSDMQMLPPTVAVFKILKDASSDLQHSRSSGPARQSAGGLEAVQFDDRGRSRRSPALSSVTRSEGQANPSRSTSVSSAGCGSENSQVPPPSQAWPAGQLRDLVRRAGPHHPRDGVEIHASPSCDRESARRRWCRGRVRALRQIRERGGARTGVISVGHWCEPKGTRGGRSL